ncbi:MULTISPECIES: hypothetical protein [unclassified Microcoleus]|uniref:hypothetical protein n=1 Tax=unclassified Microcoleus TaxID=2642155 RepID=UPI002FD74D09
MGKKSKTQKSLVKKSSLLFQRLQEALDRGSKIWIKTNNSSFGGIPINLFGEFIELLVIVPPNEQGENTDAYGQVTWLIRLSDIIGLAYPTEYWSKDRLESLLPPDPVTSEIGD